VKERSKNACYANLLGTINDNPEGRSDDEIIHAVSDDQKHFLNT